MHAPGLFGDRLRIPVLVLAPPDLGDQLERDHQGGGAGEHDIGAGEVVEQPGVGLQGGLVGRFERDAHDDEVQRAVPQQVVVAAVVQFLDMPPHGLHMFPDGGGTAGLVLGSGTPGIGRQGHLRIEDDRLAAGQGQHEVGFLQCPVRRAHGDLCLVLAAALQAGGLEDPFHDQLAPVALRLGVALDGAGQVVGFLADLVAQLVQGAYLLDQAGGLLRVVPVYLVHALAEGVDLVLERQQQAPDPLAALLGEYFPLVLENAVRQVLELGLEPVLGGLQELQLLGGVAPFVF